MVRRYRGEDDAVEVREVVLNGVGVLAKRFFCLADVAQDAAVHKSCEDCVVDALHYVEFVLLGLGEDLLLEQPLGSGEEMLLEKTEGFLLLCLGYKCYDAARLFLQFLFSHYSAYILGDMVDVSLVLVYHLVVDIAEIGERLVGSCSPILDVVHHNLEVIDTELVALHLVGTKVLALVTRVGGIYIGSVLVYSGRVLELFSDNLFQVFAFLLRSLELRIISVSPLNRPFVVRAYAREEKLLGNIVLLFCKIQETGIVHNGRRVAVLFQKLNTLEIVNGVDRAVAAAKVMHQSECVPDLVRRHEADELSHKLRRKLHAPCHRV